MNCKHCGEEMEPGIEGHRPTICPNVGIFWEHGNRDSLTGKVYEADANPVHCTDYHAKQADEAREEYEKDNCDWEYEDGPNDKD